MASMLNLFTPLENLIIAVISLVYFFLFLFVLIRYSRHNKRQHPFTEIHYSTHNFNKNTKTIFKAALLLVLLLPISLKFFYTTRVLLWGILYFFSRHIYFSIYCMVFSFISGIFIRIIIKWLQSLDFFTKIKSHVIYLWEVSSTPCINNNDNYRLLIYFLRFVIVLYCILFLLLLISIYISSFSKLWGKVFSYIIFR